MGGGLGKTGPARLLSWVSIVQVHRTAPQTSKMDFCLGQCARLFGFSCKSQAPVDCVSWDKTRQTPSPCTPNTVPWVPQIESPWQT